MMERLNSGDCKIVLIRQDTQFFMREFFKVIWDATSLIFFHRETMYEFFEYTHHVGRANLHSVNSGLTPGGENLIFHVYGSNEQRTQRS